MTTPSTAPSPTAPAVLATKRRLAEALDGRPGRPVHTVMTMGALHEGHQQLFRAAVRDAAEAGGVVLATVFVNPLQFGPSEDYERYPRQLDADLKLAQEAGVELVFAPSVEEMYPGFPEHGPQVRVTAGPMGERFEGASRPGHFDGMLTVVHKLLQLTRARRAYFGQKDAQQLALIRRMAADLDLAAEIVAVPTQREASGLARSSRNVYLTERDRAAALALSRALFAGRNAAAGGAGAAAVRAAARQVLDAEGGLTVEYAELIDPADFTAAPDAFRGPAVLAVAARVGTTRLIDNLPLEV
ncbi:pantoate--beta-alanine ligase [Mangrovactinospora gilvigrisea]|uniref:Pantothenate synthetase n=1 Tax=Mangrovactinospora gilvigrisea TaxID=1428644 RepID=A0A1J7C6Y7_9ACTN|nr:pantoate--beta-alanine ligase [Mangrovactinospora gilvigrisea]OIV37320.1 pantoate--beta-alanine ligase [Mangrovactinospora gilvigrisea]